jgi:hypothetical protein
LTGRLRRGSGERLSEIVQNGNQPDAGLVASDQPDAT